MNDESIHYEIVTEVPVNEIVALYESGQWWEESPHNREIIPGMIQGSFCFLLATHQGSPIGMGRVISDGYSDGYIQDLVVKQAYRGQGIGKEIVRRLTHFCMEKGLDWVGLIAEPKTQTFYEELGFRVLRDDVPMIFEGYPK